MQAVGRRAFVLGSAVLSALALEAADAEATLVRGLTLRALVARSQRVILLRPLESYSHYVLLGGRRSIVTDTRVRVEDIVAKQPPEMDELLVRTLGGRVAGVGEIVHGQAELEAGGPALAFLKQGADGEHWVMGMAQGHYPIDGFRSARARLAASRNLPSIQNLEASAVRTLAGKSLDAARAAIQQAGQ